MKTILALALCALSFAAHGVTISIDLTPQQMNRLQAAVGEAKGLKTPDTPAVVANAKATPPVVGSPLVPGIPRDATNQEVKAYLVDQVRSLVHSVEQGKKRRVKEAEITPATAFEVQ